MNKKLFLLTVGLALAAGIGKAQVTVDWIGADGFVRDDGVTGITNPFPGTYAFVQLIFTPDYNGGIPLGALPEAGVMPGEQELDYRWVSDDQWGSVANASHISAFQSGYIYARIFDGVDSQDLSLIQPGHHYYWGPLMATIDNDDATNPDIYVMHRTPGSFDDQVGPGGSFLNADNNMVIPEPSVLALLGLGGILMLIRRRYMS